MSCKFLLQCGAIVMMALTLVSCDKDDDSTYIPATDIPAFVGLLSSGNSADKNLPEGYKIEALRSAYDSYTFEYDKNGKLISICGIKLNNGILSGSWNDTSERGRLNIGLTVNAKGLLSRLFGIIEEWEDDEYYKETYNLSCTYNTNDMIRTLTGSYEYIEDGDTGKGSIKAVFNYNGLKLISCTLEDKCHWKEDNITEIYTSNVTLNYDKTYNNTFFQYTEDLINFYDLTEILGDLGLPYLGLLGKASAMLPTSIKETWTESNDEGVYSGSRTLQCEHYAFNTFGALSSAGDYNYYYTSKGNYVTREQDLRKAIRKRISKHHNAKHTSRRKS